MTLKEKEDLTIVWAASFIIGMMLPLPWGMPFLFIALCVCVYGFYRFLRNFKEK